MTTNLTNLNVEGHDVPVTVDDDGKFHATVGDAHLTSETLATLKNQIKDSIIGSRLEIPFVFATGRRGVMRGFHAANKDILVTWSDGTKARLSGREPVFLDDEIDDATVEEILRLEDEITVAKERLGEIRSGARSAKSVVVEKLGEDLFAYRRQSAEVGG